MACGIDRDVERLVFRLEAPEGSSGRIEALKPICVVHVEPALTRSPRVVPRQGETASEGPADHRAVASLEQRRLADRREGPGGSVGVEPVDGLAFTGHGFIAFA